MKRLLKKAALKKEAMLLDSWWFILKSFFAVFTAYLIAHNNSFLVKDRISVLFGLMLALEPATLAGIKRGMEQITATILGAVATAVIISVFQINSLTIALSIAFTLYICLKINWRQISPVAIFTAIYMTQYIQLDAAGNPSIIITFKLRILALGTGVLIAIIYNFIFSFLTYRKMVYKRVEYLLDRILYDIKLTVDALIKKDKTEILTLENKVMETLQETSWVMDLFEEVLKEHPYKGRIMGISREQMEKMIVLVDNLKTIAHLNYDMLYVAFEDYKGQNAINCECIKELDEIVHKLDGIKSFFQGRPSIGQDKVKFSKPAARCSHGNLTYEQLQRRLYCDIREINAQVDNILENLS